MISITRHIWIVFAAIIAAAIVADSRYGAPAPPPPLPKGKLLYLVCSRMDGGTQSVKPRLRGPAAEKEYSMLVCRRSAEPVEESRERTRTRESAGVSFIAHLKEDHRVSSIERTTRAVLEQ